MQNEMESKVEKLEWQLDGKMEQIYSFKRLLEDEQSKKEEYQDEIASLYQKISDMEEAQAAVNHDAKSSSSSSSKSEKKTSPKVSTVLNE